jgi:hypothetical protein
MAMPLLNRILNNRLAAVEAVATHLTRYRIIKDGLVNAIIGYQT